MEEWLAAELRLLGVEDEQALIPYVLGILQSSGTVEDAVGSIEPFCQLPVVEFHDKLSVKWTAMLMEEEEAAAAAAKPKVVSTPIPATVAPPAQRLIVDEADKEATLRMARQIADKEVRLFESAVPIASPLMEESSGANRQAVQSKLQHAQKQREEITKAKLTQSKSAAQDDRKDKEQRKLDRQKKAQKGERRG
ncbi:hypothetical protein BASA81_006438 [Batrachochytrium salamandrivorans]|nr:hypothetical protein BASA81_006438 [Batrachochytrium salamandrivorans]